MDYVMHIAEVNLAHHSTLSEFEFWPSGCVAFDMLDNDGRRLCDVSVIVPLLKPLRKLLTVGVVFEANAINENREAFSQALYRGTRWKIMRLNVALDARRCCEVVSLCHLVNCGLVMIYHR